MMLQFPELLNMKIETARTFVSKLETELCKWFPNVLLISSENVLML